MADVVIDWMIGRLAGQPAANVSDAPGSYSVQKMPLWLIPVLVVLCCPRFLAPITVAFCPAHAHLTVPELAAIAPGHAVSVLQRRGFHPPKLDAPRASPCKVP
jgi:hypothetical protein